MQHQLGLLSLSCTQAEVSFLGLNLFISSSSLATVSDPELVSGGS